MATSRQRWASGGRKPPEMARIVLRSPTRPARRAFTLVELMVAISIIILLAGLTVAFLPSAQEQQRSADGASQLQRWLSVAQQRARRDQAGRGLRLIVGAATNPLQVLNCQYLEQPDDYFVQGGFISALTGTTITFKNPSTVPALDFYQGLGPADSSVWAVQPGDAVEVNGGGVVHLIPVPASGIAPTASVLNSGGIANTVVLTPTFTSTGSAALALAATQMTLVNISNISKGCYLDLDYGTANQETVVVTNIVNTTITFAPAVAKTHAVGFTVQSHGIASVGPGTTYRIIRAPRVTGDEVLELPPNVVIDLGTNSAYGNPLPLDAIGNLNIMFAPTGAVTTPGITQDYLALWVRDVTAGPSLNGVVEFQLGPSIIAVYVRTGFVAAHLPNPQAGTSPTWPPPTTGYSAYQFLTDGGAQ